MQRLPDVSSSTNEALAAAAFQRHQVIRDGYAAARYILGYVLKSDTDTAAQKRFEDVTLED